MNEPYAECRPRRFAVARHIEARKKWPLYG